jgi:hypothetical protein
MLELSDQGALGENFLWCAGIQEDKKERLYIDGVHYAPNLSKLLAKCIFDLSMERKLLDSLKQ